MKIIKIISVLSLAASFYSCQQEMPTVIEGNAKAKFIVIGDTSVVETSPVFAPLKNAKVIMSSEYGVMIRYTDDKGILNLDGIPSATYSITARMNHPKYPNILLVGTSKNIEIVSGKIVVDTIKASQVANTGIAINEIYACGPINNIYFFYDQFIELYNYSDETKYLDGMIIMRVSGNTENGGKGPGADEGNDGDLDGVTYIFQVPGKPGEKNYPFYAHTYKVLAATGINHKINVSTSVDLSKADWEFYNQYSVSDFDNPSVPNLINLRSDRTVDFLINLVSDIIIIASGTDSYWEDGIDFSTVIDGVDYKSSTTAKRTMDNRIDKSFALSPARYSGKSMQRREPGGDSNDAISDWEIINTPTPGRQ